MASDNSDYEDEEPKKPRKWKKKLFLYLCSSAVFILPLLFVMILAAAQFRAVIAVACFNDTTTCTSYPSGTACTPNTTIFSVNGGTSCKTLCPNNMRTFSCNCPAKKAWEDKLLTCSWTCLAEAGDCVAYTSGNHCISTTDTNNGIDCIMDCANGKRSFNCTCPAKMQWSTDLHKCLNVCDGTATEPCSATGQSCIQATPADNSSNCVVTCNGNFTSYKCDCAANMQWVGNPDFKCMDICLNNLTGVECIADARCIKVTSTSHVKNETCKNTCDGGVRNHVCECTEGNWDPSMDKCILICPDPDSATFPASFVEGESCIVLGAPIVNTKMDTCRTTNSSDGKYSFICDCITNYVWSYYVETPKCQLQCRYDGPCDAAYSAMGYCIDNTANRPDRNLLPPQIMCFPGCLDNLNRAINCDLCINDKWNYRNSLQKCIKYCDSFTGLCSQVADNEVCYHSNTGLECNFKCVANVIDYNCPCTAPTVWKTPAHYCG